MYYQNLLILALIDQAGLYGRILTKIVSTDWHWGLYATKVKILPYRPT